MKKFLFLVCILLSITGGFCVYAAIRFPTTSALNVLYYTIEGIVHPHQRMNQQVIAFLPYWRLRDSQYARFDLLSEINYFGLTLTSDGNFTKINGNQTDPGWLAWNSQTLKDLIAKTQLSGGSFSLTLASQKNSVIEALLHTANAQQNLTRNIIRLVQERHLNGITLDFEYDGKPDQSTVDAFTHFLSQLATTMKQDVPQTKLSLTLLPLAGREPGLFNLPALTSSVDRFIGMSYDYYAQTSDIAGPVAPMHGFSENKFFFDVVTTYNDYLKVIPKQKILMGVPYYGYDWAVVNGQKIQSKTLPLSDPNSYAAVLSYARARSDTDLKTSQCTWDDYAQEHWCWYRDTKNISHQVWLEDNDSLAKKFLFAKQQHFLGIAIWTLGYDKGYPDLWNMIGDEFTIKE